MLYTGNNHYDSLFDIVNDKNNISGFYEWGDNYYQVSTDNDSKMTSLSQIRDVERVENFSRQSKLDLYGWSESNDVLLVTRKKRAKSKVFFAYCKEAK
jgi:hypothetical protein